MIIFTLGNKLMNLKNILLIAIILLFSIRLAYSGQIKHVFENASMLHNQELNESILQDFKEPLRANIEAVYYLRNNNIKLARKNFQDVLQISPDNIFAKWGLAEILRLEHEYEESTRLIEELLIQDERFYPTYVSLAYIKYISHNTNESIDLLNKLFGLQVEMDVDTLVRAHSIYAAAKGIIAYNAGPLTKAVNGMAVLHHLKHARELKPDSAETLFGYGSYYMLIPNVLGRDMDKAKEFIEKAIGADPNMPEPYVRLAQIYKQSGHVDKYNFLIDKALSIDPQNELALDIKTGACKFICLDK